MRTRSIVLAAVAATGVAMLARTASGQGAAPAPGSLTGEPAARALIGNTVGVPEADLLYFLDTAGRYTALEIGKTVDGSWTIAADKLCLLRSGRKAAQCWGVEISGTKVVMSLGDFRLDAVLLAGNPRGL